MYTDFDVPKESQRLFNFELVSAERSFLIQPQSNKNFGDIVKKIFKNKPCILLMLALTSKYFIFGGILYWYPTYLTEVLLMDERQALNSFSYISIFAPTSGVILGGFFTSFLGGYNTKA